MTSSTKSAKTVFWLPPFPAISTDVIDHVVAVAILNVVGSLIGIDIAIDVAINVTAVVALVVSPHGLGQNTVLVQLEHDRTMPVNLSHSLSIAHTCVLDPLPRLSCHQCLISTTTRCTERSGIILVSLSRLREQHKHVVQNRTG